VRQAALLDRGFLEHRRPAGLQDEADGALRLVHRCHRPRALQLLLLRRRLLLQMLWPQRRLRLLPLNLLLLLLQLLMLLQMLWQQRWLRLLPLKLMLLLLQLLLPLLLLFLPLL